jgi:UPF0042 nucleotide-binding protein
MLQLPEASAVTDKPMHLVIISGRSGSGKSTVLNVLEDVGYYCIDNLPLALLPELIRQTRESASDEHKLVAVCIDARNATTDFSHFATLVAELPADVQTDVIYLDASTPTLFKRFSETRRKHPLSNVQTALREAIVKERALLQPIANAADLVINTSQMSVHELRAIIKKRVLSESAASNSMAILFMSFGFKRGIPIDADMVYDVRCLPNPYWVPDLRSKTGLDSAVKEFLDDQPEVIEMFEDIRHYLDRWLPRFAANNRSYMTIAIGCTGGMHRSVYLSERLRNWYASHFGNVQVHHRELAQPQ